MLGTLRGYNGLASRNHRLDYRHTILANLSADHRSRRRRQFFHNPDADLADQVWGFWDAGLVPDEVAIFAWCILASSASTGRK